MSGIGLQHRRRHRNSGRAPRNGSTTNSDHTFAYRRLYDPRRWHKRKHREKAIMGGSDMGQPPAGWVLVWAGRFKRWRRRWFVAHPPGLLLYYKNSDQIGRPGCISLLGATVVLTPGKERQLKIIRGSVAYYLRTLNKINRKAWVDTIYESIRTYNKSLQKAAIGAQPGRSLLPHQSIPEHLKEEWEETERELNRRLAERMQEVQPVSEAFLQQLQALQQSLSVISGALGFTSHSDAKSFQGMSNPYEQINTNPGIMTKDKTDIQTLVSQETQTFSQNPDTAFLNQMNLQGTSLTKSVSTPVTIHGEKSDAEYQISIRSSTSEPLLFKSGDSKMTGICKNKQQLQNSSTKFGLGNSEHNYFLQQGSCIDRQLFEQRQVDYHGVCSYNGHLSDSEISSGSHRRRLFISQEIDSSLNHIPEKRSIQDSFFNYATDKESSSKSAGRIVRTGTHKYRNYTGRYSSGERELLQAGTFSITPPLFHMHPEIQGPIHAAWSHMQNAFAEVLKEEIHRVLELEAENSVLQKSLSTLPQSKQDQKDSLDVHERIQRGNSRVLDKRKINGVDSDDEDTDDELSIVQSEVSNEDYFEALEVLNQHEFIAKSTTNEELELLAEQADSTHEPPEEADYSVDTENLSEAEGEEYEHPRTRLPAPKPLSRGFSLWTVLKNAIGKDLNRITMPATINEPLSVLQRCAEELQHRHLLEKASQLDDSIERLLWVSVHACATYYGSIHRDAKPFNPLLGETYEWLAPDGRTRFLAEQVSHHPPILAYHVENSVGEYSIYGDIEIKNKFWGKSVEVLPAGVIHLRIPRFGDHFTWTKVTTCIHNVVIGKLWIDNYGDMVIRNHSSGEVSHVRFHKANTTEQGHITGKIFDGKGILQCSIHGNYMNEIFASPEASWSRSNIYSASKSLWKIPEPPEDYDKQYCFSRFTIGLNELTPKLAELLPPTDARFRPDQRALEDGDFEKATAEKFRLEEKQRDARRQRKEKGQQWKCMWFEQRIAGNQEVNTSEDIVAEPVWVYKGEYWSVRENQDWQHCPDIM